MKLFRSNTHRFDSRINNFVVLGSKYRPIMVDFLLPESDKDQGENPIVDSLAVVSEWTIVAKCALHGLIYMWDLKVSPPLLRMYLNLVIVDYYQVLD